MLEAVTSEIATWLRYDNNTKEDASSIHRWTKHRLVFDILYYHTLAVLLLEEIDCFFNGKSFDMANVDHCEQEAWMLLGYACDLLESEFEPKFPAVQFVEIRGDDEANEAFWEEIEENATDVKARDSLAWCLAMMDKTDDALPVIKIFLDDMVPKGRRKADVLDNQGSRFRPFAHESPIRLLQIVAWLLNFVQNCRGQNLGAFTTRQCRKADCGMHGLQARFDVVNMQIEESVATALFGKAMRAVVKYLEAIAESSSKHIVASPPSKDELKRSRKVRKATEGRTRLPACTEHSRALLHLENAVSGTGLWLEACKAENRGLHKNNVCLAV
ncbi:hypothetical protein LTR64_007795 [Lithohypha guttulata]|uniref:uncharacterized protein n=1 Tax=Lithohypha guttulata TaxID=1690604 RepID=UPI002DE0CF9A|nr:hypothetical protein LTR51_007307 [Lithohypha guttulata]